MSPEELDRYLTKRKERKEEELKVLRAVEEKQLE
jgi:hypothetical protein